MGIGIVVSTVLGCRFGDLGLMKLCHTPIATLTSLRYDLPCSSPWSFQELASQLQLLDQLEKEDREAKNGMRCTRIARGVVSELWKMLEWQRSCTWRFCSDAVLDSGPPL